MSATTVKATKTSKTSKKKQLLDWLAKIAKSNTAFEEASPNKKRVILAQDVIAALKARRYTAHFHRGYLKGQAGAFGACTVCAKGALFLAKMDRVASKDVVGAKLGYDEYENAQTDDPSDQLISFFSQYQLDLIEAAFESWDDFHTVDWGDYDNKTKDSVSRFEWYRQLTAARWFYFGDSPEVRLTKIMEDVILNGGDFSPADSRTWLKEKTRRLVMASKALGKADLRERNRKKAKARAKKAAASKPKARSKKP